MCLIAKTKSEIALFELDTIQYGSNIKFTSQRTDYCNLQHTYVLEHQSYHSTYFNFKICIYVP